MRSESVWKGHPSPDVGSCPGQRPVCRPEQGAYTYGPTGYPEPNQGMQATTYSLRFASASRRA